MNQQERDEIRQRHVTDLDAYDRVYCTLCGSLDPCDVIQVLNAWEAEFAENTKKCEHIFVYDPYDETHWCEKCEITAELESGL